MRLTLRSALVLAAILLLAGATTSFAQAIFTASAGNPPMRIGSQSDAAGDVALTATNGAAVAAVVGPLQMVFTYNVPITNKTLRSVNSGNGNCPVAANASIVIPADATVGVAGIGVTVNNITCSVNPGLISWVASGTTLTLNFGAATTAVAPAVVGPASYQFVGPAAANTNIQLHGVRLNVASLGVPPSVSTLTTFINTAPSLNLQLAAGSTSLTVGTVSNALDTSSTNKTRVVGSSTNSQDAIFQVTAAGTPSAIGSGNLSNLTVQPVTSFSSCSVQGSPQGGTSNPIVTGGNSTTDRSGNANFRNAVGIRVTEAYSGAFTSRVDEGNKSNGGEIDNGVRLRIDITGLPAQVSIAALQRIAPPANPVITPSGQASSGLVLDLVGSTCFSNAPGGACGGAGVVTTEIRANASGAITFEYEVISNTPTAPGVPSSAVIPLWVFASTTPTDLGTANISIRLSPINGSTILRFTDAQSAVTGTVDFKTCNTDLYFPFVTNQAGFDTGVAVINGGQSAGGNTGQSGACTAKFYDGSTSGKTAVKSTNLPSIGPGAMTTFVVSDSTLGKPGFQGTLHVTCPFQRAHGYAYVTFGFGSAPVGSAPPGTAYLALACDGDSGSSDCARR